MTGIFLSPASGKLFTIQYNADHYFPLLNYPLLN